MAMGGFDTTLIESNPIFPRAQKWVLQSANKQTVWQNHSEHWSLDLAVSAALLEINFNPSLVMRVINSLTLDVEWTSDNLTSSQIADTITQKALGIGSLF